MDGWMDFNKLYLDTLTLLKRFIRYLKLSSKTFSFLLETPSFLAEARDFQIFIGNPMLVNREHQIYIENSKLL